MKEMIDKLSELLRPYLPEEKGQVFFNAKVIIEENARSKELHAMLDKSYSNEVMSCGVIIDSEHGNHQVLYNHSHKMESGFMYNTILGRPLNELSKTELENIYNHLSEKAAANKIYPAVIREDYDEDIGDIDHAYFAVVFNKPFDEEQEAMADHNECETINPDKSEYIFMDYDNAIGFASDNARALELRGNIRREIGDDDKPYFFVTFETADPRLDAIARKYNGGVDYTASGTPLACAGFLTVKDARAYRDEAKILLYDNNTIRMRKDIPEKDVRQAEHQAKQAIHDRIITASARSFTPVLVNILKHYRAMFSDDTPSEELYKRLFNDVIKDDDVSSKSEQWKKDTWTELSDLAKGITHESAQGLKR